MTEIKETLERIERRVEMPEPAMERMLRRRERRDRTERIAAAAVGLGITAIGIVGALVTLRVTGETTPASGGSGATGAAEGGGFVLPTVAIWTALVVLVLTLFAAMRLRARFADTGMDVEREGREPGGAAASARRPAAAPGTAPWKGGNDMDSKPKTDVGIPRTEMPPIRLDESKGRHTNRWLVGAVVLLAIAVVGLGAALIVQAGSGEATPEEPLGLADQATVGLVDDFMAAQNSHDANAVADLFLTDGVYYAFDSGGPGPFTTFEGRSEIADFQQQIIDLVPANVVERVSPVVQVGDLSAFAVTDSNGWNMVWVQEWKYGKIARMWGMP